MKRNEWDVCFNAYTKECTRFAIYIESLKSMSTWFKVSIIFSILFFIVFVSLAVSAAFGVNQKIYSIYFATFIIFEVSSLILILKAQKMHRKEEYSDYELSQIPPEDYKDQKARYLKFRRTLNIYEVKKDKIPDILDILECRILVNRHRGLSVQKVMGFSVTFAMSILIATMKNVDLKTIGQIGAIGAFAIAFVYILMSLKPNKTEQLYELKYFLTMFAHEDTG